MSQQKNLAQIKRTRGGKFRCNYFGKNGEPLSTSEVLNTRNNAKKNIVAHINLSGGTMMLVLDLTGKKPKEFFIDAGGKEDVPNPK